MSLQPSLQHRPVAERELLARVPPFPPVALKLQRMMASAEVNVPDVVGLLRADPVLSVQLLRVANSALF
ncbi:MAG: HDOD domain-containing protein, partial [Acidobacteria bacterium]|nr:HDOD domain-containing protein [Acidobacteriota bacterium]